MRLLTHNMLSSSGLRGVVQGYPLKIIAKEVKIQPSEFNGDFVSRIIPKLNWQVLLSAAREIGHESQVLPDILLDGYDEDESILREVHHLVVEIDIIEGELICPESGRRFPITEGIPNMLLKEDEV